MIDDRLREILINEDFNAFKERIKPAIAQIKQAFQDEGWGSYDRKIKPKQTTIGGVKYMTGQAWFDRFKEETKHLVSRGDGETWMGWGCGEVVEAARKASGIDKTDS